MQVIIHQHISLYIKDDITDYLEHSEVHIGKFWDAEKKEQNRKDIQDNKISCACTIND